MSVRRRKAGGVYHYDFTDENGERHRGSTRVRDKAAALKVEDDRRRRAALGAPPEPVPNLEAAFAIWFKARVEGKRSRGKTARCIEVVLRLMDPRALVTSIDTPDIEDAIQARRLEKARSHVKKGEVRSVSNATINRELIDHTLRPMLRYFRRVKKLPVADPVWKDLRLPEPIPRARERAPDELEAWRAALPEWHRPLMDFYLCYGVRWTEAFFPPDAYNPATGRLTLGERKAGDEHGITLLPEHRDAMAERARIAAEAALGTVWFRERRGKLLALTPRGFQSASSKARRAAGIPEGRAVHDFRHHAGTATMRAGKNLMVVKKLLGHASIISTARYAHASDDDVLNALRLATGTKATKRKTKAS